MSEQPKHTPGPWAYEFVPSDDRERALPRSEWSGLYVGPMNDETGRISHTIFEGGVTHGEKDGDPEADAALIAAAPSLYEALERIAGDNWSGTDHMDAPEAANTLMRIVAEMQAIACAALSLARGEG